MVQANKYKPKGTEKTKETKKNYFHVRHYEHADLTAQLKV